MDENKTADSDEFAENSQKIYYFLTREDLLKALKEQRDEFLPKGCAVLVKASHGMKFEEVIEYLKQA